MPAAAPAKFGDRRLRKDDRTGEVPVCEHEGRTVTSRRTLNAAKPSDPLVDRLFDRSWYCSRYPDVAAARVDPRQHYLEQGAAEGRQPNPLFDGVWYRRRNPDVAAAGADPLTHFAHFGAQEARAPHPLFDPEWYRRQTPDAGGTVAEQLLHFLEQGGSAGLSPHPLFDSRWYLNRYPDVAASGQNPLVHYLLHGPEEDRRPHPLFDLQWYRRQLNDAGIPPAGDLLRHYVERGATLGFSPHPLFDAHWYLRRYRPDVAAGQDPLVDFIVAGSARGRMPHPLFDPDWYRRQAPDAGPSVLDLLLHYLAEGGARGLAPHPLFDARWYLRGEPEGSEARRNPLIHYLTTGAPKDRSPHPLFEGPSYLADNEDVAVAGANPLAHYLESGWREGRRASHYFDGPWYIETYPDVAAADAEPLTHYLTTGAAELRRPHPMFDPVWYAALHPDITARTALVNFIETGLGRGDVPHPVFDPVWYREANPDVAQKGVDPFQHYIRSGQYEERRPTGLERWLGNAFDPETIERILGYYARYRLSPQPADTSRLVFTAGEIDAWVADMRALAPDAASEPDVSIIVPVYNHFRQTMACIHSLLELGGRRTFEIIVADDASTDETAATLERGIPGIRHVRGTTNRGFIANCNAGAAAARGRYVLFLNNDTLVLPGWLDELVDTAERDPSIGLVGSKLVFADGKLQEAGGIIWQDGSAWNYGRGDDPMRPAYSYMRDVDYASGASIMLPRSVWTELGGFDDWYDVAYGEDSDLAFRVRQSGRRVVMQPLSVAIHFEGVSSGTDITAGVKAYQVTNAQKLYERWKDVLASHRPLGEEPERERERGVTKRILVIDAVCPAPDEDAGSLTCFELMRAFQAIGYKVTFMSQANLAYDRKRTSALQRLGIEAIYYPYFFSQEGYLRDFGHLHDLVLVFRNEVAFRILDLVHEFAPQARIMFHVSDLHFVREARQAALGGGAVEPLSRAVMRTRARELFGVLGSDLTIVHSWYEKDVLAKYVPEATVYVFPWIVDPRPVTIPFGERHGIAFLAGYGHPPNVDAVLYFVAEIWPKIHAAAPEIVFNVVGSHVPPEIRALDGVDGVKVVGYVADLADCFDRIRVSIAPLRYGAGIKGKVAMSLAYGVPVVATTCAAEGMALTDGVDVLVRDDPQAFADAVLQAHEDAALWRRLSDAGLAHIDEIYSSRRGLERVREIVALLPPADSSVNEVATS